MTVIVDGTNVDGVDVSVHAADIDAHHSAEVARGRPKYGATELIMQLSGDPYSMSTISLALNVVHYFPMIVHTPITIDSFFVEITIAGGAGTKGRFGIYKADTDWQPTDLVVASAEFAVDGVAVVETALASTVLQEGRYLKAITMNATATFTCSRGTSKLLGAISTLGANAPVLGINVAKAYAALADPGTAWDTVVNTALGFHDAVWIGIDTP